jgi:hypothetical protein
MEIYTLTDIYEGELIEISVFVTEDEARARFEAIVADDRGGDQGWAVTEGDFPGQRHGINDAGRELRISVPVLPVAGVVTTEQAVAIGEWAETRRQIWEAEEDGFADTEYDSDDMYGSDDDGIRILEDIAGPLSERNDES